MNELGLDPRQAPVRAELLLAADFGQQAAGRPIHGRLESEDGAGEPGPRLKLGAVRTRRLVASEGADRPSGSAYGNPLRGTRESTPIVPIGAPLVARTDVLDAQGGRLPGGAEQGRHLRPVDRARPGPRGADARRAAGGRDGEPRGGAAPGRRAAARLRELGSSSARLARKRSRGGSPPSSPERPSAPAKPRSRAARQRWRRALTRKGGRA